MVHDCTFELQLSMPYMKCSGLNVVGMWDSSGTILEHWMR